MLRRTAPPSLRHSDVNQNVAPGGSPLRPLRILATRRPDLPGRLVAMHEPALHQNASFNPNCSCLGSRTFCARPKVPVLLTYPPELVYGVPVSEMLPSTL